MQTQARFSLGAKARVKQLSGLDATFLYLETPEMPMHVGALHVFELPAGYKGKFITALRKHMTSRLPVAPVLRRRLWWMPLNLANPAWVDADPDMRQHIVEITLPKGSGVSELEAQVSRLHPVLLDRTRPLWKFHVFEGLGPTLEGRKRVGLYTQLHHAAVDGQAAVALANDSPFGLGGSIFTSDTERGQRVARAMDTGMVFVNSAAVSSPELPFGGVKNSGYGRELSAAGILEFVNRKLILVA